MKTIQEQIRVDLLKSIKHKQRDVADSLKVILGELQRQHSKNLSYTEEVQILKRLEKYEEELLNNKNTDQESLYLKTIRMYLPIMANPEEIIDWILNNVDFSSLKSPMQAVGVVMKEFGVRADGRVVKDIVIKMSNKNNGV